MNKLAHIIAHTLIILICAGVVAVFGFAAGMSSFSGFSVYDFVYIFATVIALIDFCLLLAVIGFSPEENPTLFNISTYYLVSLSCAGLIYLVIYVNFIL